MLENFQNVMRQNPLKGITDVRGQEWSLTLLLVALIITSGCAYFSPRTPLVNNETNTGFTPDRFSPPDWPFGP